MDSVVKLAPLVVRRML